jgi:hypothetical protein
VSEISTRIWLDERLWNEVTDRAVTEGMTVRELIPRLVNRCLAVASASTWQTGSEAGPIAPAGALPSPDSPAAEPGLPVVALSDIYRCGVCGAEVRLGGVSQHMNKHKKERESSEAERS